VNAWKITLPLAIAFLLAGMIVGSTYVSLVPSTTNNNCGSGFDGGSGSLSENEQAACAPILSERDIWGTTLVCIGFGLFGATYLLNGPELLSRLRPKKATNQKFWPPSEPPVGYRQGPDGGWVWDPQGQPPPRGYPPPPHGGYGSPPPPNDPRRPQ
jgi:hypothetical protein